MLTFLSRESRPRRRSHTAIVSGDQTFPNVRTATVVAATLRDQRSESCAQRRSRVVVASTLIGRRRACQRMASPCALKTWNGRTLPSDHPHRTFVALSIASLLRAGVAG